MRKLFGILFTLLSLNLAAQKTPTELAQPIVDEGKRLYKSEMASWFGTDVFLEIYTNRENIGGYFSYADNGVYKCIFFSSAEQPKVIGTIAFDSTYNVKTAAKDLTERAFTKTETEYFSIRQLALKVINEDTLFKNYKNMSLNLIPMISDGAKKVYVLTGPKENGIVVFGNDYLLTFDNDLNLITKKQLHRNIIPINYDTKEQEGATTMHSHLPETGEFITATDICTLMLYAKFAKWKQHNVVSKMYLNVWNCQADELFVIPMSTIEKINKDREKQKKSND